MMEVSDKTKPNKYYQGLSLPAGYLEFRKEIRKI
jgi:hypothetical protein